MVYLLLGAVLLGLVFFAARAFLNTDPKVLARLLRYTAVVLLALVALVLAVSGRAVLDLPFGAAILYLLRHWFVRGLPGLDRLKDWLKGTPHQAGHSTIETTWLRMTLDQASGALNGEVLSGRFGGARLDQLGLDQLRLLLAECETADAQSARLLETYLDRAHPGWREQARSDGRREDAGDRKSDARMTREEAWQVLGLEPGAGPEAVREAHRRLMLKLHPDHGGSNYLASKINAARDLLLET